MADATTQDDPLPKSTPASLKGAPRSLPFGLCDKPPRHRASSAILAEMFSNASQFTIRGNPTFNNVSGDQVNHQTINAEIVHLNSQGTMRSEYDEYEYVKQGNILFLKKVHSEEVREWELRDGALVGRDVEARRNIYTVELNGSTSKFTAMTYEGRNAQAVWKEDFQVFSCNRSPEVLQLYGINRSRVPALIFHHELVPLANFYNDQSLWIRMYIKHLAANMRCFATRIWMDTSKGLLCKGLDGPYVLSRSSGGDLMEVPSTIDMLNEDTCVRYFGSHGSRTDRIILDLLLDRLKDKECKIHSCIGIDDQTRKIVTCVLLRGLESSPHTWMSHQYFNELLRFDAVYCGIGAEALPVARHRGLWRSQTDNRYIDEKVYRLTLWRRSLTDPKPYGIFDQLVFEINRRAWLLQLPRIHHNVSLQCGRDKSPYYYVISPSVTLEVSGIGPTIPLMDPHDIYFFLQSPSRCQSQLELEHWQKHTTSYWSTDPTGQSQLTESQCKEMGLPVAAHVVSQIEIRYTLTSCSPEICAAVDAWQLARGFDPATADFARHLGCPEFELVHEGEEGFGIDEAVEGTGATVEHAENFSNHQEPLGQDAMDMEAQHFLRLSSPSVTARPRRQAAIKASTRMKSVDPCSSQQGKQRVGRKRKSSEGCGTERGRQTIKRRKIH